MFLSFKIDPNRPSFRELNEQLGQIEEHLRVEEESEKLKKIQQIEIQAEQKPILYTETPVKNGNLKSPPHFYNFKMCTNKEKLVNGKLANM